MSATTNGWIDVSIPMRDRMISWPGDPDVVVRETAQLERGDPAALRGLVLGTHSGTHVDAPAHYLLGGKTLDDVPFENLIGRAQVTRIPGSGPITREALRRAGIEANARVILRTENSDARWFDRPFQTRFVHLSVDAAEYLAELHTQLIGVDYLSVGGFDSSEDGARTHRVLLGAGVWILEGLFLGAIEAGPYELVCLPLRVERGDGAPARAVLRRIEPTPSRL